MSSNPTDNSSPGAPPGSMMPPPALSEEEKNDYAWKSWKPDTGVGDNVPLPPITEQQVYTAPSPSPSGWNLQLNQIYQALSLVNLTQPLMTSILLSKNIQLLNSYVGIVAVQIMLLVIAPRIPRLTQEQSRGLSTNNAWLLIIERQKNSMMKQET